MSNREIFHKAARDGYLELLKETTRKDCDRSDEDGMTPTIWAAYHGNVEALRLLVSRGGNPNKSDYLGRSGLHHAASNGHMTCVTFLVNFGANIWAMDNDFHTPIDVAALQNRTQIVKYLDGIITKQTAMNKKVVKKMKEKAVNEAQKRIRRYEKLQSKAEKRAMKEEKRLSKEREKMGADSVLSVQTKGSLAKSERFMRNSKFGSRRSSKTVMSEPKPFSYFTLNSNKSAGKKLTGVAKKLRQKSIKSDSSDLEFKVSEHDMDGTKTIRSLAGLRRDSHIMYVRGSSIIEDSDQEPRANGYTDNDYMKVKDTDRLSKALSEPDLAYNNGDSGVDSDSNPPESSIFERPGFGSVAFLGRRMTQGTLMSLPPGEQDMAEVSRDSAVSSPSGGSAAAKIRQKSSEITDIDSIGTLGSLAGRIKDMNWEEEDLLLDDDDIMESSPLEMFLAANGLTEFISLFSREKIDLEALMLLSDQDLKDIGLPLGPRRKLLDAIALRKRVLFKPGIIVDTAL